MAGYKGFGYAATIEILCSALQDNKFGHDLADTYIDESTGEKKRQPSELGHFFIAIDVEKFAPLDQFKEKTRAILQGFRDAKKDPNFGQRVYTAGEPEHLCWRYRSNNGGCPVPRPLQKNMEDLRDSFAALQGKYEKLPWEQ
jgi:LDH2 family malate/lactate/ureidoglycolate dehydrogenase